MKRSTAGFTLVELMVALSLFAMISVAALALLRSSIDTQAALAGRMDRFAGLERARALIADGLLTAQPLAVRTAGQESIAAFTGAPDRMRFASVAPSAAGGSMLTQFTLSVSNGQLTLERGGPSGGRPAVLVDNIARASFRFRDSSGTWQSAWVPERPDALPRAAELTIQPQGGPEILMRFIVAPDWSEASAVPT